MKPDLANNFNPNLPLHMLRKQLSRLSATSLTRLAYLWCNLKITQPQLREEEYATNKKSPKAHVQEAKKFFAEAHSLSKRQLLDRVLIEYWHRGLNLLQLSQIDCQLLIDQPQTTKWNVSKVVDSEGRLQEIVLPQLSYSKFLRSLSKSLDPVYLNHIYICHHPIYPAMIVRVQLFDSMNAPRRPFFAVVPASSSSVIHSVVSNDIGSKIVLQSLEQALSSPGMSVHIKHEPGQVELANFEAVYLSSGVSRFANCRGNWAVYSDNNVDISPFELLDEEAAETEQAQYVNDVETIANLRFKGSKTGEFVSSSLYEKDGKTKGTAASNVTKSKYASIVPEQSVSFKVVSSECEFDISFAGNDVFGGIHELCVESKIADVFKIPDWLTGENLSGIIENGEFVEETTVRDSYFRRFNSDGGIF